ncbi:Sds3-like-domain-containing protein [Boeremia exigua]|uniref:Sds3-like-domain-containing protein n=1 Tax=Boeremia exigua TaxID=749465 RepID=UPI001E8D6B4F|nr:Sds3-like-domain-containing protein [Boeremia exigua]KAH6638188.1 Sds3-like-domain-containing protein [Boeremia exigua]
MDTALRATVEKDEQRRPSPMTTPTRRPEVEELSPVTRPGPAKAATTIISAVPAPTMITTDPIGAAEVLGAFDDHPDDRSSSLSELGDASDVESEQPTPLPIATADLNENDSEAETERLEETPRKLIRTVMDTSDALYTRTPSKLVHSKTIEHDDSAPHTPSDVAEDEIMEDADDVQDPLHALSLAAASEAASLELAGKKRKRMSARGTPIDDHNDEPARKRSASAKAATYNGTTEDIIESSEHVDAEEELDNAEERLDELAREEIDLEERQANLAAEAVSELATIAKHPKPRKGGRRGKRKAEDSSYAYTEALATTETVDGDAEGDENEEDSATLDEEVAKKKSAIDELAKIEKKFKLFREKLCDEQIAQYEKELEMLKQPECQHPEYLAMIKCIDDRRADKIDYEKTLLELKQQNLVTITAAQRHQMHSQYFQTVRDVREDIIADCNKRVFELQRGRRSLGCDETEYMNKLPEKRSDQIRQQTAYNLEVSILSGVAKYVGFPAAPDISAARPSEVDEDLRAMKIATHPTLPVPPPSFRTYNQRTTADEVAAESEFLESTPWANPRHPSHQETRSQQESRFAPGPSRVASYQTPAGQRRIVDINAPNGSASTIEANSNPPSSNTHNAHGRTGESESPVMQMKRPPAEYTSYVDTPGSHPRNMGLMGREAYGILSSPAAQHAEPHLYEPPTQRWGVPSGSPAIPPGPPGARAALPQRSGLGMPVGGGLFGR